MLPQQDLFIKTGYQNGLIGWVSGWHGRLYQEKWNFGQFFESKVARQLCDFLESYDPETSCIWSLSDGENFFGSITLDGSHAFEDGAHIRWFVLDPDVKGQGHGKRLLQSAMNFARHKNYPSIYLWTLAGLEPAGQLYRKSGFVLEESLIAEQWGQPVAEEKLRLTF